MGVAADPPSVSRAGCSPGGRCVRPWVSSPPARPGPAHASRLQPHAQPSASRPRGAGPGSRAGSDSSVPQTPGGGGSAGGTGPAGQEGGQSGRPGHGARSAGAKGGGEGPPGGSSRGAAAASGRRSGRAAGEGRWGGARGRRGEGRGGGRGALTSSPWPKRRPSAATRSTRRKPSGSRPHTSNTWRRRRTERSRAAGAPAQPAPPAIRAARR